MSDSADTFILYDHTEQPGDAILPAAAIVASLTDARGPLTKQHLPFEVKILRIRKLWGEHEIMAAQALREELRLWCIEQWGPGAIGGVLNPVEARHPAATDQTGFLGCVAKVPFDTTALWSHHGGAIWYFKDERHAALFKLRAY